MAMRNCWHGKGRFCGVKKGFGVCEVVRLQELHISVTTPHLMLMAPAAMLTRMRGTKKGDSFLSLPSACHRANPQGSY